MKSLFPALFFLCLASAGTGARADLCDGVTDTVRPVTPGIPNDLKLYEEIFPGAEYQGDRRWNEIILECNRRRDTKGGEILRITGTDGNNTDKQLLKARDLEPKVIRGHYDFVGLPIGSLLSFKYVYILEKRDGVWTMTIPYKPSFNELVPNRVDFSFSHARQLYEASQVVNPSADAQIFALKEGADAIATTLCATSSFFPGGAGQYGKDLYKRDPENRFISLGRIQYQYEKEGTIHSGCRVNKDRDLYWRWDPDGNRVARVKPQQWILDNFVRTAESYWSIPRVFTLKLLLQGHNEASFPKATLNLLRSDDYLTSHFATKFLRAHFNQMYKSNVFQVNNFSTMTTDESYWHEVGHALGLDDEYGFVNAEEGKNSCRNKRMSGLYATATYQMCEGGAPEKRTIYHYLAASRYVTRQSECDADADCKSAEYCDKGTLTVGKNQCVAKKPDNATCDVVGGGHQCESGQCRFSRCYTPRSVAMGGTCYNDDACKAGKCSAVDGARGTCVCQSDGDCGTGSWCDAGLDTKINACRAKLAKGAKCGSALSVGNDHKCKSGECSGFPKYECK